MTLDEAIRHCEEVAEDRCDECGMEHHQLAEWLKELKERRENECRMNTLDEVIKAFECCDHGEPDSNCEECPYVGIGCCCLERENDALHYLKEYQRYQDTPSCNGHMSLVDYFEESQKNEPLTWDELKLMKDKPVWWTHGEVSEWLTIYSVPKNDNNVIYATTCSGVECWIYKKDMDKYNYYKKELE